MFRNKFKKKKEEKPKMSTLEDVKKAYEDLSDEDKKSFHQSIKDRVRESVGEQEHLDGDEDSQDAKDRINEAEGAEKADEEKKADEAATDTDTDSDSDESKEAKDDTEAKTEGGNEPSIGEVMELLTKMDARISAIEHAKEAEKTAVTEVGVDGEFVDEIAPSMPASYLEQAKKMRY